MTSPEPVKPYDHPDYISGVKWSDCELRWINTRLGALHAEIVHRDARIAVLEQALEISQKGQFKPDASLLEEIGSLRQVCAEAYQLAGALNASDNALDNLAAAANGDPLPHESFLPVDMPEMAEWPHAKRIAELEQQLSEAKKDAERFIALQNMPAQQAQAFFWHYTSRKERAKAIDAAMKGQ